MERLSTGIPVNEAEVRYAVCNQFMGLVCDVFNYKLTLEDRVTCEGEEEEVVTLENYLESIPHLFTPPQAMQGAGPSDCSSDPPTSEEVENTLNETIGSKMSPNNRCDYRLFKCTDTFGDTKLMAIIDAKKTMDVHAIAQLVGYYSHSNVSTPPPGVIVMSCTEMQLIFFPFVRGADRLVNAIALTPLSLWDQSENLDFSVMRLYLGVATEKSLMRNYTINTEEVTDVLPEDCAVLKTTIEERFVTDGDKAREMKAEITRIRKELKAEKAQKELQKQHFKEEEQQMKRREQQREQEMKQREQEMKQMKQREQQMKQREQQMKQQEQQLLQELQQVKQQQQQQQQELQQVKQQQQQEQATGNKSRPTTRSSTRTT
jgi:hypothetical protein